MEIVLNIFLIQFLMVAAIDYLGFVDEALTPLLRRITGSKIGSIGRPWNCSTCSSFWIGLIYLLFAGSFTLPYIGVCMLASLLTPVTLSAIHLVKDAGEALITFIYKLLNI